MLIHPLQFMTPSASEQVKTAAGISSLSAALERSRAEVERALAVPAALLGRPSEGIGGA